MAEQQHAPLRCLPLQIIQINHQRFGDLYEDRGRPHRGNRPRHRCQSEGIGEHPIPRANAHRTQGRRQRIAPRRHRQAIARTGLSGEILL